MRTSLYFYDALWICENLGLFGLMELHEDYNITLVQQLYSIVVFGSNQERTMPWMTGDHRCTANFYNFADANFETFQAVSTHVGVRMHSTSLGENKNKLAPLYGS